MRESAIQKLVVSLYSLWNKSESVVIADWCEERQLEGFATHLREGPSLQAKATIQMLALGVTYQEETQIFVPYLTWQVQPRPWLSGNDMTEAEWFLFNEKHWPDGRRGASKVARFHKRTVRNHQCRVIGFSKHVQAYSSGTAIILQKNQTIPELLHRNEWDDVFNQSHLKRAESRSVF